MRDLSYRLIPSDRKTIALQITPEGELTVRCPRRMKKAEVDAFVHSKQSWIEKHLAKIAARPEAEKLTLDQVHELADRAVALIPRRVDHYAALVGVTFGKITIRNQHGRWGSCSAKGNLNFNCLLMLTPPEVLDYVVVHELCHRRQLNHSPAFWSEVESYCPDYKRHRKWLKENGGSLIARLP